MVNPKVLFISHDASRTGAPIVLLNTLRWLKSNSDFELHILFRENGELFEDFASVADAEIWYKEEPAADDSFLARYRRAKDELVGHPKPPWVKVHQQGLIKHYLDLGIDLLYSNTVANGDILTALWELRAPIISHLHEMETVIRSFGLQNWETVKNVSQTIIVPSLAAKQCLVERFAVEPERIEVVYEFIDLDLKPEHGSFREATRDHLQIPRNAFVLASAGTNEWRKGTDLFIELAAYYLQTYAREDVFFLWFGGWPTEAARAQTELLKLKLGCSNRVVHTDQVKNPLDYHMAADVFALTSLEDPFPLVCLEAVSLGKPVLCFQSAGGMPEFVKGDAGFVVPFMDIAAMAEKIEQLYLQPELSVSLGKVARNRVFEAHSVEVGAGKIYRLIQKKINERKPNT